MDISDTLLCLFSAQVERRDGAYVIEVPERELRLGELAEGETYRVTLLANGAERAPEPGSDDVSQRAGGDPTPPVEEGEIRVVEIEDIGDQGDGITRVERGFVVIVPETEKGERVTVEITDVRRNVAFADVRERHAYYE